MNVDNDQLWDELKIIIIFFLIGVLFFSGGLKASKEELALSWLLGVSGSSFIFIAMLNAIPDVIRKYFSLYLLVIALHYIGFFLLLYVFGLLRAGVS